MQQRHPHTHSRREREGGWEGHCHALLTPVVTKVYTQSIWTAFHYGTQLPGLAKANANANGVGAILRTLRLPPNHPAACLTSPNHSSLLWGSVLQTKRISGPYRAWHWSWSRQPSWAFWASELPKPAAVGELRTASHGSCLYCRVRVRVWVYCIGKYSHDNRNFYWIYAKIANFICPTVVPVVVVIILYCLLNFEKSSNVRFSMAMAAKHKFINFIYQS